MSELDFWNYQLSSFDPDLSDTDSSWSCGPPQASLNHGPEGLPRPTAAPPGPPRNSVPLRAPMATVDSSSKAKGKQVRLEQERQARGTSMTGNAPNAEVDDAYQEAEEEAFEHRERRYQAALILESYERLAWHANTERGSSVIHYVLCGCVTDFQPRVYLKHVFTLKRFWQAWTLQRKARA